MRMITSSVSALSLPLGVGVTLAGLILIGFGCAPIFGFIANSIDVSLYPVYLAAILALMIMMYEKLVRKRSA